MAEEKHEDSKTSLSMMSIGVLVVFLVIVGGLYWWVSKKGKGEVVFPAGLNYTGNEPSTSDQPPVRPSYNYQELAKSADWIDFVSPNEQYTFKHPSPMVSLIFPGDPNDSATFDVADVPAQFNLMVLVETISNYDTKLRGQPEQFVRNYHTFFEGLKGLEEIESFKTDSGLSGWRVRYVNADDQVGADNYFFTIPGQADKVIHVNNVFPADGLAVFTRILNSLTVYKK